MLIWWLNYPEEIRRVDKKLFFLPQICNLNIVTFALDIFQSLPQTPPQKKKISGGSQDFLSS